MGMHLIKRDLATVDGEKIRHNPDAIAASIVELICEDLKFRDMQNNPEYMILNDKLKFKKKKIKEVKKHKVGKLNNIDEEKKSKFFDKYEERIKSIRERDKKSKNKNRKAKTNQILSRTGKKVDNNDENNNETMTSRRRKLEESIEKFANTNRNQIFNHKNDDESNK